MKRLFSPLFALAAMVAALCGALYAGLVLGLAFLLPQPARRVFYVAHYRVSCLAYDARRIVGSWLFALMCQFGLVLRAFPGTVTSDIAFGIVGECAFDGPWRSQPARINHGTAVDIVIGRWFTLAADGSIRPGGAGAIGGICTAPKTMSSAGGAAGPLSPSMTLLTGTVAEFVYMGAVVVACTTAAALGQAAWYDTTTGVIGAGAPGAGQAAIPNSKFIRVINAAAGLAVLELTN